VATLRALMFICALWPVLHAGQAGAQQRNDAPNSVLLVAKPSLADPNFRETVVLAHQTDDGSTVGVILNRPAGALAFGGPVMREATVVLFRSERAPEAPAFRVLKDVYLSMHPRNIEMPASDRRLFGGFAGWAPGQLQRELARDDWFTLPATSEIVFRADTRGLWEELVRKARGRVAMR
jgi:putative transcriptional regulator